jgi:tetratricopeptide (TPR) repeat protein
MQEVPKADLRTGCVQPISSTAAGPTVTPQAPKAAPPNPGPLAPLWAFFHSVHAHSLWHGTTILGDALYKLAVRLPWVVAVAIIAIFLIQGLTQRTTSIEPISVPKALAESGYTPEVAGQRLRDAIVHFVLTTKTYMKGPNIALHGELPNIVVPTVGISLDTIASSIRTFLRSTHRRSISGEFTIKDKLLWLRLRIDGRELYSSPAGGDPERPDELLAAAAPKILEVIQPYLMALSVSDKDAAKGLEMANGIIARLPEWDDNVAWSHNLIGTINLNRKEYGAAIDAFNRAIHLKPRLAAPHYNLGNALNNQGKYQEAIAEYRKAIDLDEKFALPHNGLGNALRSLNRPLEAIAEYRKAIDLDPKDASPHNGLGSALRSVNRHLEAIVEYRKAIDLDPKDASPHNGLGNVLRDQHKHDEAIVEYRKAIDLDPKYALPHNGLGNVLRDQHKHDEAIVEYRKAIDLDPKYALAHYNLGNVLRDQGKDDEAVAEYQTVLTIDPNHSAARTNLDNLLKKKVNRN